MDDYLLIIICFTSPSPIYALSIDNFTNIANYKNKSSTFPNFCT